MTTAGGRADGRAAPERRVSALHDLPRALAREAAGLLARRALGLVLAADLRGHSGEDTDRGEGIVR